MDFFAFGHVCHVFVFAFALSNKFTRTGNKLREVRPGGNRKGTQRIAAFLYSSCFKIFLKDWKKKERESISFF